MTLHYFRSYRPVNENDDEFQQMSDLEKKTARSYVRFVVSAKRDNDGVVLLSKVLLKGLEKFLELREVAGVLPTNPFVFGLPPTDGLRNRYMEAYILLRNYSQQSGALEPSTLRGTMLRKQLATTCANKDVSDAVVEDIARHLSHAKKIHKSHYRQPALRDFVYVSQHLEDANIRNKFPSTIVNDIPEPVFNETSEDISPLPTIISERIPLPDPMPATSKSKIRTRWTSDEVDLVSISFASEIHDQKYPPTAVIKSLIEENVDIFRNRSVFQVKAWLSNLYRSQKK